MHNFDFFENENFHTNQWQIQDFPYGGVDLVGGGWTPEAVMFRKFCMSKRKNWDPWGARTQIRQCKYIYKPIHHTPPRLASPRPPYEVQTPYGKSWIHHCVLVHI